MFFSFSEITRERRSGPRETFSSASSKSIWVMTFRCRRATLAADRVDLVDEDDAWGVALRLIEQVTHPRRADADEHLDELGARDREERHAGLAGDRAREHRFAGAGRPDQEHAARDPRAE